MPCQCMSIDSWMMLTHYKQVNKQHDAVDHNASNRSFVRAPYLEHGAPLALRLARDEKKGSWISHCWYLMLIWPAVIFALMAAPTRSEHLSQTALLELFHHNNRHQVAVGKKVGAELAVVKSLDKWRCQVFQQPIRKQGHPLRRICQSHFN